MDATAYPRPLFKVCLDVAEGVRRAGHADKCAGCFKPFNAIRKQNGVVRAMLLTPSGSYHSWSWLLCRKCHRSANRNGNEVPEHLKREAEQEAALLMAPTGGVA